MVRSRISLGLEPGSGLTGNLGITQFPETEAITLVNFNFQMTNHGRTEKYIEEVNRLMSFTALVSNYMKTERLNEGICNLSGFVEKTFIQIKLITFSSVFGTDQQRH